MRPSAVLPICAALLGVACGGKSSSDAPAPSAAAPATPAAEVWPAKLVEDALPAGARARLGGTAFRSNTPIGSIAASADGQLVAANERFGLRVWDAHTGATVRVWREYAAPAGFLTFAGRRLVFAHQGEVVALDVDTGRETRRTACSGGNPIAGLAVALDARSAAVLCRYSGSVMRVPLSNAEDRPFTDVVLLGRVGPNAEDLTWSADGAWIATGGDAIRLIDVAAGKVVAGPETHGEVPPIAFSPTAPVLAYADLDEPCTIAFYDLVQRAVVTRAACDTVATDWLVWSRDGTHLAYRAAHSAYAIVIADAATGTIRKYVEEPIIVGALAFANAAGTRMWFANDHAVRLWDIPGYRAITGPVGPRGGITALAYSPDGTSLAAADDARDLRVWSLPAFAASQHASTDELPTGVAWTSDGSRVLVGGDRSLLAWTIASGEVTASRKRDLASGRVVFAADRVATQGYATRGGAIHGAVHVNSATTGALVRSIEVDNAYSAIALSADGKRLAAQETIDTVVVRAVGTGAKLATFSSYSTALALTADGARLAVCGSDCRIYDLATKRLSGVVTLRPGVQVSVVAPAPGGRFVVGTDLGEVLVATPQPPSLDDDDPPVPLQATPAHREEVTALAIAPDGKSFASGGNDGQILLWPL